MRALKIIEGIRRLGRRFSDAVQMQLVWIRLVDFLVLILAAVFPWSTTAATGLVLLIFPLIWITHGTAQMIAELKRPACALPVALVVLAVIGTSWSVGTPWPDRLHALTKVWKLLWLWPLYLHFQKTPRIVPIFAAYAVSNLLLLMLSSLMFLSSDVNHLVTARQPGVPLKNYIDQSQGFVFVAVILLAIAGESLRDGRRGKSILFGVGSAVFFGNLAFVNVARTAFFYIPVMLSLVGWRYARRRLFLISLSAMFMVGAALWASSPVLQSKVSRLLKEVDAFRHNATVVEGYEAGGAERLEFWRKSIGFVSSAPIIGHGTGSTEQLIADATAGETGLMAKVVDNPHNQRSP
jgi:O-antigen ligase